MGQRDRVAVNAWNIEEDLTAAHAGQQSRQNYLGGGAVVGHQWADLAALPAWANKTPAGKPSIAHQRATDMPGRADPGAQERGARSREHGRVVRLHARQWDFAQRDDASLRRLRGRDGAAVTDVGISELESGPPVVLLLRHHAIEPDHAWTSVRDGRVPYAQSVAAAAQVLSHDIETEEGEARTVVDAGDGRGRSAFELADEEAFRIGRGEAGVVGEARVPAFGRRPVHG